MVIVLGSCLLGCMAMPTEALFGELLQRHPWGEESAVIAERIAYRPAVAGRILDADYFPHFVIRVRALHGLPGTRLTDIGPPCGQCEGMDGCYQVRPILMHIAPYGRALGTSTLASGAGS